MQNGELDALMDVARDLNVLEVFLFDVIPTGRLSDQRECLLTDEEAAQIVEFRQRYTEKPDYPRIVHQTMFASIAYPCVAEGCPAAMVQVHLRANGDVSPCDFTPYSFGSIRRQSLREIWETMAANPLYAEPSARCRLSARTSGSSWTNSTASELRRSPDGTGERIVLTGATGFLGQQILRILLECRPEARLVLLVRDSAGPERGAAARCSCWRDCCAGQEQRRSPPAYRSLRRRHRRRALRAFRARLGGGGRRRDPRDPLRRVGALRHERWRRRAASTWAGRATCSRWRRRPAGAGRCAASPT